MSHIDPLTGKPYDTSISVMDLFPKLKPKSEWGQPGFVVVSDAGLTPMVHAFRHAEWEAQAEMKRIKEQLPPELREGIEIVPCKIVFTR